MQLRYRIVFGIQLFLCSALVCTTFAASYNPSSGRPPGIVVNITAEGIDEMKHLVEPTVWEYIQKIEPITLSDIVDERLDIKLNLSSLVLSDLKYEKFDFIINEEEDGLQMTITGLSGTLAYNCMFEVIFPPWVSSFQTVATFNDTYMIIFWQLDVTPRGKLSVSIAEYDVSIGNFDSGIPLTYTSVLEFLNSILKGQLNSIIPGYLSPLINEELKGFFDSIPMQLYLDNTEDIVLDYTLTRKPSITSKGIGFELNGDAFWYPEEKCKYWPDPMKEINEKTVRIYMSEKVLDCSLQAFENSGDLKLLVGRWIDSYIPRNSLLGFTVNFTADSSIEIVKNGIVAKSGFSLNIDRYLEKGKEKYISVPTNLVAVAEPEVETSADGITASVSLKSAKTSLFVDYFHPDLPKKYQTQIRQQNWTSLSEEFNSFLNNYGVKVVNNELKKMVFTYDGTVFQYLTNVEVWGAKGYAFTSANIAKPSKFNHRLTNLGKHSRKKKKMKVN